MISDFQFGTANAQPVTLSFWAYSNKTGTHSGSFGNYDASRNYPFTYSIPVSGVWTRIVVAIPGDTAGTWVMAGNAGGAILHFDLGAGSSLRAGAGAWTSTGVIGATGAVSLVATASANWLVTGVKLEIGSVATPFNRQSLAKSMADCQRYYQQGTAQYYGYHGASSLFATQISLPVSMRAGPTIVYTPALSANATGVQLQVSTLFQLSYNGTVTSTGGFTAQGTWTASAEL